MLPLADCELAGIVTTPRDIRISYAQDPLTIRTHATFDAVAAKAGCELVCLPERPAMDSYLPPLRAWRPDLIFVLGWYYRVPRHVRAVAASGCLGIHASLLPKYRGGAPIAWAIINGETQTGVTLFHLEDAVDAGDIVAQMAIPIDSNDTCADVINRVTDASIVVLRTAVPLLAAGVAPRTPQHEVDATYCAQRQPEDGRIDWKWPAVRVHNFVRAQTRPYDGAFTQSGGHRVRVWAASPLEHRDGAAGEFRLVGDVVVVNCGSGALAVRELGLPGADACPPSQFAAAFGTRGQFDPE